MCDMCRESMGKSPYPSDQELLEQANTRINYLENKLSEAQHEISRLSTCRDKWKRRANSLAERVAELQEKLEAGVL